MPRAAVGFPDFSGPQGKFRSWIYVYATQSQTDVC